jgi:hypothetical protein
MTRSIGSRPLSSTRSKVIAAISSVMAIAFLAALLPSAASAVPGVSSGPLQEAGVLRLRLGAQDLFRFEPVTGSAVDQSVAVSGSCKLTLATSPAANNLVSFLPNGGSTYAGFVGDSIGVKGNEGNGTPCGRIDPGQVLTMNLNQGTGATLAGKAIDFAEMDLELKFGGTVKVDGYLVQGSTATLMKTETYGSTGSDSGPDSGDGDNYRVRFPKTGFTIVNRLVFSIVGSSGGASLEGGSDGTQPCDAADGCTQPSLGQALNNTTDTLFHLVKADGFLNCGDTFTETGNGVPTNSLQRLDNASGACVPIPFSLDASLDCTADFNQCVLLQKDLLGQNAQFFWTVTWAPEDGQYMETETEFDFGFGFQKLQLCLADDDDADAFPELPPRVAPPVDGAPNPDPWCVVNTATVLDPATGLVTVTEKYFGSGDPGGSRH